VEPRLLIVGDPFFLARHRPLVDALRQRLGQVDEVPVAERVSIAKYLYLARGFAARPRLPVRAALSEILQRYKKEPGTFDRMTALAAKRIARHAGGGTFALQVFSMWSPVTAKGPRPYAHYVDMTMALVRREWPAWAPYASQLAYDGWIEREGASYRAAERVFTFSEATRRSVIDDYGARPERVIAVGAAGHYAGAPPVERTYGNHTAVFNGSDFERKGGDRALAALRIVRRRFPAATLTVVGNTAVPSEAGVLVPGTLGRAELFALFDRTDVVVAPTRFDGLPGFVLEAMSRGTVPVLSDAIPMGEIIVDGREGFVVSPPTPEPLAERIEQLFADESRLRTLGAAARARVLRDWNWDAVARRMVDSLAEGGLL